MSALGSIETRLMRLDRLRKRLPRMRSRTRRHTLVRIAVALVVVMSAIFGVSYRQAQAHLKDKRAELAEVEATLAEVQAEIDAVLPKHGLTNTEIVETQAAISAAIDARTWIDAAAENARLEAAGVQASRTEIDTARMLTALHSNEVDACLGGITKAVTASRDGDDAASTEALKESSPHCAHTLAYATGAQFPYDFADPFVLWNGEAYYGYSTNSGAGDVQVIRSTDMVNWELVGNALSGLADWAIPNFTWAPAVLQRGDSYVLYYTVRDATNSRQCISRAVASSPVGPFEDDSAAPLVCQLGGSIDPSVFVDADGRAYLLWKAEATLGSVTGLWAQPLSDDGRTVTGLPQHLLQADRPFEHGVVEAPTMVHAAEGYFLVYSAANWNSRRYTTAYARCLGPLGPCGKPEDGRVLQSGKRSAGPGGTELFRAADGTLWSAFHAFAEPNVGYPASRYLHLAPVRISGGRVSIEAAT